MTRPVYDRHGDPVTARDVCDPDELPTGEIELDDADLNNDAPNELDPTDPWAAAYIAELERTQSEEPPW